MRATFLLIACALFIAELVVLFVTRKSDSGAVLLAAGTLWATGLALYITYLTGAAT